MDQNFSVNFNIKANADAEAALKRVDAAAQKVIQSETKLAKMQDDRKKRQLDAAETAMNRAGLDYAKDPTAENLKKAQRATAARNRLMEQNEERTAAKEIKKARDEERQAAKAQQAIDRANRKERAERARTAKQLDREEAKQQKEQLRQHKEQETLLKQQAADRRRQISDQARGARGLAGLAIGQMGLGAGASTFGNLSALGDFATLAGYGRAGSVLTKAAVPLAVAAEAGSLGLTANRLRQDEYMTGDQRERALVRSNMLGRGISDVVDNLSGRARGMERAQENRERDLKVNEIAMQRTEYQYGLAQRGGSVRAAIRGAASYRGAFREGGTARDGVGERREYDLQTKLIPVRRELAKAEKEYATAKYEVMENQSNLNRLETQGNALQAERQKLIRQTKTLSGPALVEAYTQLETNDKRINQNLALRQRAREDVAQSVDRREAAMTGVNEGRLNVRRAGLENLRDRERQAEDRAVTAMMMGPVGRMEAKMNLQMVQSMGIENAPAEMISAASALFPKTIQAMALKDRAAVEADLMAVAPDEYNESLTAARRRVDEEEAGIERQDVANQADAATRTQKALDELAKNIELFGKRIGQAIDQFDKDQRARRAANN